jgi:hypothetical protein
MDRSSFRLGDGEETDGDLRLRLRDLAAARRRFGYRRLGSRDGGFGGKDADHVGAALHLLVQPL